MITLKGHQFRYCGYEGHLSHVFVQELRDDFPPLLANSRKRPFVRIRLVAPFTLHKSVCSDLLRFQECGLEAILIQSCQSESEPEDFIW